VANRRLLLGIDIGGTKVALALGDADGGLLSASRHEAEVARGPDHMLARIVDEAHRLLGAAEGKLEAIGISCGGALDRRRGLVLNPPNLPGWDSVPVVAHLSGALQAPASLDNDANLAALGEHRFGAGRPFANLVYVTVSTGIGGGIISEGKLVRGLSDSAGELGHQTLDPQGPPCGCGNRGCLEALSSGGAIAREARRAVEESPDEGAALLALASGKPDRLAAWMVAQAAAAGDALAAALWHRAMEYLGLGIANVVSILAPQAVIIGGGMIAAGELLLAPVRSAVRSRVRLVPAEEVAILPAALGPDSALRGALALALELA
jgi:glucokinase